MFENPDQLEISCQQTKELLDGENRPILIDCREQHEFDFCRIEGAILIPLSDEAGREKSEALLKNVNQEAIIYFISRAINPGQYAVPPAQIESMYSPQSNGLSDSMGELTVQGR